MTLSIGTRIGPYEVTALLGTGGMGEVYRGHDDRLGRDVALKVLPDAFAGDSERLARFQREAQVLAALKQWRKTILAFAAACVGAAGILIAVSQPSPVETQPRVETSIAEVQATAPVVAQPAPKPRTPRSETRKPAATSSAGSSAARSVNAAAPKPERTETTAKPVAAAAATTGSAPAPPTTTAPAVQGEAATITGCLEFDDDRFRLKDTEGEDAPRARSWRSGFLRRGNARVDIVDAGNRLRLTSHVGHRVSVTGMLADRQMDARSLKMVADTCDG